MKHFLIFQIFFFISWQTKAVDKTDFEGCPENSLCTKETGINYKAWIELIKDFNNSKIEEKRLNEKLQISNGFPIAVWGNQSAIEKQNSVWWDSPCAQHKTPNEKYYIGEVFVKNLKIDTLKQNPNLHFSRIILKDKADYKIYIVPRGDGPLNIINNQLYFTKEIDGQFYGLLVSLDGIVKVTKTNKITQFPTEVECPKEMSAEFYRSAPQLNFFKGTFCKNIWDQSLKSYRTLLMGWSCN